MFSTTTMASSTTKPTAMTIATKVRLFRLKPNTYIKAQLAISDTPSTLETTIVADHWRRNSAITPITSATAIIRVSSTSCSEARMVWVRSLSTETSTEAGSISVSFGRAASTRSTVSTMFAPGWRKITRFNPGWSPDQALLRDAGAEVTAVGGCCGLAGNFGVEKGHYEVSVAVAETALLPAVRAAPHDAVLLADGFSCRTQLEQLAGAHSLHLAQLLDDHLEK